MKIFTFLSHYLKILFSLSLLTLSLSALDLAHDTFDNGSTDGWGGDNYTYQDNGWLYFTPDGTASKTYNFGPTNANKTVTITYNAWVANEWENFGPNKDYFNFLINDTIIDTILSSGGYFTKTVTHTLDANGAIKISFNPNTTTDNEYSGINDITISTEDIINIDNANDICYLEPIQDGTRTITPIKSLSDLSDVIVYFDTSSLITLPFGGSSIDDCSVDDGAKGINCQEDSTNNSIGPVGVFNEGGWTFDLGNVFTDQDRSISTYDDSSFFDFINDFFSTTGAIQATYTKDGINYQGEIKQCATQTNYIAGARDFELINPTDTQNIIGNTQIVGNTVECVTTTQTIYCNQNTCWVDNLPTSTDYSNLTCDNTIGDVNDNNYIVKYLDIDDDDSTFNSTSATIELPSTYKEIAWVGLFWQAHINNTSYKAYNSTDGYVMSNDYPNGGIQDTTANKVKLKIGSGSYTEITANELNYFSSNDYARYSAFANITDQFTSIYTPGSNILITVGDILASQGTDYSLGNYAAWTLVIVYKEDELNALSKLRNNSVYLGYQYVASGDDNNREIVLNDFILPKTGPVESQMAVFAAEGEYAYKPDTMKLDSTSLGDPDTDNVFDARLSNFIRNPSMINNNGIDIDVFDTSDIMTTKRDADPNALSYSATIYLTSDWDLYYPSMVSFTTELYRPRVCYYIDTIKDSSGTAVFEDKAFVGEVTANEEYTFDLTIANMRASLTDGIQDADLVQIYMKMTNLDYTAESTSIKNSLETTYSAQNDAYTAISTDLGDYNASSTTSNWRLGIDASNVDGGKLVSVDSLTDANNAHVFFKGEFNVDENATNIDLLNYLEFKASFRVDGLVITPENASLIVQCVDLNTSGGISAPAGAYNAVDAGTASIKTKISGRAFPIQILSYIPGTTTPQASSKDLTIDVIVTPVWIGDPTTDTNLCTNAPTIGAAGTTNLEGADNKIITIPAISSAYTSATIRITDSSSVSCATDPFAIRPEKFTLSPPAGSTITELTSGQDFLFPIEATLDGLTTATPNYTIASGLANFPSLDADKVTYLSTGVAGVLNGTLTISPIDFSFTDGVSGGMPVSFSDVGKVEINLKDKLWAAVDASDGTPQDCTDDGANNIGAYICGKITPTYIPDHFTFVTPTIRNDNGTSNVGDFTYIANAIPTNPIPFTMAGRIDTRIEARNSKGGVTKNFDQAPTKYENPININVTIAGTPLVANVTSITPANLAGAPLGFNAGTYTVAWNSTDVDRMLRFNFPRQTNTAVNPFQVLPANVTLTASSTYGATTVQQDTSGLPASIGQSATFVYGRTHAPRQRFTGNNGVVNIFYENFCYGTGCDKSLLPNGMNSTSSDDPRWFINTNHFVTAGNVGIITQKSGANDVTAAAAGGIAPATVPLTYNSSATKGYPFKTTMENNASTWLIYNKYNAAATTNEFEVEFTDAQNSWAGQHETNTTTNFNASQKTNRRTMW